MPVGTGVTRYEGKKQYYSTGSIADGVYTPEESYTYDNRPSRANRLCYKGDLIEAKMQATNKCTIIDEKLDGMLFSTGFFCFRAIINSIEYLKNYINSEYFQKTKDSLCSGVTQKAINDDKLFNILLPLPPLNEQYRINEKIVRLQPLLDLYKRQENNLSILENSFEEKLKASILQYAIEGKLVKQNPDDEPANVLLERIKKEKERLVKEGKIKRDKHDLDITIGDDKNYYEKFPLFLPLKNVCSYGLTNYKNPELGITVSLIELDQITSGISKCPDGKEINLNTSTIKSRYYFEKGMVLYSKLRPYLDKVIFADKNGICSGELVPFWSYINTEWLLLYLHSPKFIQQVNSDSFGVKMPRVKTSTFLNSEIPLYSNEFISRTLFKLKRCNRIISQF